MKWIIPVLIVIFLILLIMVINYGRKNPDRQYDERQEMAKNKAYKYSAMTMLFCAMIYFFVTQFTGRAFAEDSVSGLLIAFAGVAVFAVYTIFSDAFFGIKGARNGLGRPGVYAILLAVITIMNGVSSAFMIRDHKLVENGILTHNVVSPSLTILFLIILISMGIKYVMNARSGREGEE